MLVRPSVVRFLFLWSCLAVAGTEALDAVVVEKSSEICTTVPVTLEATWDGTTTGRPISPYYYEWSFYDHNSLTDNSVVWKGVSVYKEDHGKLSDKNKRFLAVGVHSVVVRVKKTLKDKNNDNDNKDAMNLVEKTTMSSSLLLLDHKEVVHPQFVLKVGDRVVGTVSNNKEQLADDGTWRLKFVTTHNDCPNQQQQPEQQQAVLQNHRVLEDSAGPFAIKVQIDGDAFLDENTWTVMRRVVVDDTTTRYVPILYSESGVSGSVSVSPGDYAFEMTDSAGDGICCAFGLGVFRISVGSATAYIGGEFGFTTGLLEFTVTPTGGVVVAGAPPTPPLGTPTVAPSTGPLVPTMFDPCRNAATIDIAALGSFTGSNNNDALILQADSPAAQCEIGGAIFAPDVTRVVYYSFVGDGCPYTADTISPQTNFDTVLGLLGSNTGDGDCDDGVSCIIWDDDSEGLLSRISFTTEPGVNYWIIVGGYFDSVGEFLLTISGGCGGPPSLPPAGAADDCDDAPLLPLRDGIEVRGSTADVDVLEQGEPATLCQTGSSFQAGTSRAVYYLVEGDGCSYSADLENSFFDTTLGLLTGEDCDSTMCVVFNDDTAEFGLQSRIFFATEPGVSYWILVGGFASDFGDFTLRILLDGFCEGAPTPSPTMEGPGVEICEQAPMIPLDDGFATRGSTDGVDPLSPADPATACQRGNSIFGTGTSRTVYFSFVGDGCSYTADTAGSSYDTTLGLLGGDSCSDVECIAVNDDFFGLQSRIQFSTVEGETYWIILGGFGSRTGRFILNIELFGACGPTVAPTMAPTFEPVIATCENATAVDLMDGFQTQGTTRGIPPLAAGEPAAACNRGSSIFAPGTSSVLYFTFVGDGCRYSIDTRSSSFDTVLGILQGDCNDSVCVATDDDTFGLQSQIILQTEMNVTYYILLSGYFRSVGNFVLNIDRDGACGPTGAPTQAPTFMLDPAACQNATSLDLFPGNQEEGTTVDIEPLPFGSSAAACERGSAVFGPGSSVVFYSFVGDGCRYAVDTAGSSFDTVLGVLDSCTNAMCLAVNDDAIGLQSQVIIPTEMDVTYYLILGGFGTGAGDYVVNFDLDGACGPTTAPTMGPTSLLDAIECNNAESIALPSFGNDVQVSGTNSGVSALAPDAPAGACQQGAAIFAPGRTRVVYYTFVGDGCDYIADTRFSNFDTVLGVLSGRGCNSVTCEVANDDYFGLQSRVAFSTEQGASYWFILGGFSTSTGAYSLNVAVDPNGNCGV